MLLGSCGAQNIGGPTECTSSKCPPNLPFYSSGNYRSCNNVLNGVTDPNSCYLENGDGVIYQCDANCDCTTAQANINTWCSSLQ